MIAALAEALQHLNSLQIEDANDAVQAADLREEAVILDAEADAGGRIALECEGAERAAGREPDGLLVASAKRASARRFAPGGEEAAMTEWRKQRHGGIGQESGDA